MELNEYQKKAMATCMPSCNNFAYMSYGLVGEVGELMGKIAKHIRKENVAISKNDLRLNKDALGGVKLNGSEAMALISEIGDCLWFIAGVAESMGWTLEDVGQINLQKLASRKERGVIDGDGDNR